MIEMDDDGCDGKFRQIFDLIYQGNCQIKNIMHFFLETVSQPRFPRPNLVILKIEPHSYFNLWVQIENSWTALTKGFLFGLSDEIRLFCITDLLVIKT